MTPRSKRRLTYSEDLMKAAYKAVKEGGRGARESARFFGVPYTTLRDHLNGRNSMRQISRKALRLEEEKEVMGWIDECVQKGFEVTRDQIRGYVQTLLNTKRTETVFKDNLPSNKWVSRFLIRQKELKSVGESQSFDPTEDKLRVWFARAYNGMPTTETTLTNSTKAPASPDIKATSEHTMFLPYDDGDDEDLDIKYIPETEIVRESTKQTCVIYNKTDGNVDVLHTSPPVMSTPSNSTCSSQTAAHFPHILTTQAVLDRLLDLSAKAGAEKLDQYRTLHDFQLPKRIGDSEEQQFCLLYHKICDLLSDKDISEDKLLIQAFITGPPIFGSTSDVQLFGDNIDTNDWKNLESTEQS